MTLAGTVEWREIALDQDSARLELKHGGDLAHQTSFDVANLAAAVLAAAAAVQMPTIAVEAHLPHPQTLRDLQYTSGMMYGPDRQDTSAMLAQKQCRHTAIQQTLCVVSVHANAAHTAFREAA